MNKELEALKGIKQAIAEHLHKQTGVSVEKTFWVSSKRYRD